MLTPETMEAHILVVDDDDRLRDLLKRFLNDHGFAVSTAATTADARYLMTLFQFDLMVLDVMIPGESGLEFAASLPRPMLPILMLSARAEAEDRINGLEAGVDDYLTKPFEPKELILRIRAILKRAQSLSASKHHVQFGAYQFDLKNHQLQLGGEPIYLTTTEATLLKVLAERAGSAVSRAELSELASLGSERSVDVQITRLRKKLEQPSQPMFIQTVRGEGYGLFP
jgi:two-component system, OmpR family, phosphate regulon response regulator OmpR